ncbi:MAG: hypothetical protein R2830_02660 [Saprospiraceae bacterium]
MVFLREGKGKVIFCKRPSDADGRFLATRLLLNGFFKKPKKMRRPNFFFFDKRLSLPAFFKKYQQKRFDMAGYEQK